MVWYQIFFLKTSETICLPLSFIFRKSLDEGVVPKDWKLANVSAILKNGAKDNAGNYRPVRFKKMEPRINAGNYRPVSLTEQTCELLESI